MDYTLNFGQHRGERLANVPPAYVHWLIKKDLYKDRRDLQRALVRFGALDGGEDDPSMESSFDTPSRPEAGRKRDHDEMVRNGKVCDAQRVRTLKLNAVLEHELRRGESFAVIATAGSGKTKLLMEYAARSRDKNFLYIVYTKGCTGNQRARVCSAGAEKRQGKNVPLDSLGGHDARPSVENLHEF